VETNEFGTDEFVSWARKAGVEPMMVVNLGTRRAGAVQCGGELLLPALATPAVATASFKTTALGIATIKTEFSSA
jgi:alpha-L-arabinofuranosidase